MSFNKMSFTALPFFLNRNMLNSLLPLQVRKYFYQNKCLQHMFAKRYFACRTTLILLLLSVSFTNSLRYSHNKNKRYNENTHMKYWQGYIEQFNQRIIKNSIGYVLLNIHLIYPVLMRKPKKIYLGGRVPSDL